MVVITGFVVGKSASWNSDNPYNIARYELWCKEELYLEYLCALVRRKVQDL